MAEQSEHEERGFSRLNKVYLKYLVAEEEDDEELTDEEIQRRIEEQKKKAERDAKWQPLIILLFLPLMLLFWGWEKLKDWWKRD